MTGTALSKIVALGPYHPLTHRQHWSETRGLGKLRCWLHPAPGLRVPACTVGLSVGGCKPSPSAVGISLQGQGCRGATAEGACVCARVRACACVCTPPLPWLPRGREEGIFGALGSTVVGLITGFQPGAGGHALGRRGSGSEPCHFPASAGLFGGGHPDIFSASRRVDCRGPSMSIMTDAFCSKLGVNGSDRLVSCQTSHYFLFFFLVIC